MKLVFCDSSTEQLYLALMNDSYSVQSIINTGFTHTEYLASIFNFNFKLSKMEDINKLDYIILGKGPGSFTGIRIAYSFFKGIAINSNIPFIELNTLFLNFLSTFKNNFQTLYIPLIYGKKNRFFGNIYKYPDNLKNRNKHNEDFNTFDLTFDSILEVISNYFINPEFLNQNFIKSINFYLNKKNHYLIDINQVKIKLKNNMKNKISNYKKLLKYNNIDLNNILDSLEVNLYDFFINPQKILDYVSLNIDKIVTKKIENIEPFYVRKPDAELKKN